MTHQFRWCQEKTERLINLHDAGLERDEISRALGVDKIRVNYKLRHLGHVERKPRSDDDVDLGQKMHELARLRFSIDDCAYVLGIDLPKAFDLAHWYCVRFDGPTIDRAAVLRFADAGVSHAEIARRFECSRQKITSIVKAMRERGRTSC